MWHHGNVVNGNMVGSDKYNSKTDLKMALLVCYIGNFYLGLSCKSRTFALLTKLAWVTQVIYMSGLN
jgi:hypothetical protein